MGQPAPRTFLPGYEASVRDSAKNRQVKGYFWVHLDQVLAEFDAMRRKEEHEKRRAQDRKV